MPPTSTRGRSLRFQLHISLRDTAGHALMTTRVPFGGDVAVPPPLAEADQSVLRSGKPMVTDMFTGTTSALKTLSADLLAVTRDEQAHTPAHK